MDPDLSNIVVNAPELIIIVEMLARALLNEEQSPLEAVMLAALAPRIIGELFENLEIVFDNERNEDIRGDQYPDIPMQPSYASNNEIEHYIDNNANDYDMGLIGEEYDENRIHGEDEDIIEIEPYEQVYNNA